MSALGPRFLNTNETALARSASIQRASNETTIASLDAPGTWALSEFMRHLATVGHSTDRGYAEQQVVVLPTLRPARLQHGAGMRFAECCAWASLDHQTHLGGVPALGEFCEMSLEALTEVGDCAGQASVGEG